MKKISDNDLALMLFEHQSDVSKVALELEASPGHVRHILKGYKRPGVRERLLEFTEKTKGELGVIIAPRIRSLIDAKLTLAQEDSVEGNKMFCYLCDMFYGKGVTSLTISATKNILEVPPDVAKRFAEVFRQPPSRRIISTVQTTES